MIVLYIIALVSLAVALCAALRADKLPKSTVIDVLKHGEPEGWPAQEPVEVEPDIYQRAIDMMTDADCVDYLEDMATPDRLELLREIAEKYCLHCGGMRVVFIGDCGCRKEGT